MSSKDISIETEKIEIVKKWPKPKLIWDIQVFLDFANFYQQFIQSFNKIATPFISMLKIIMLSPVLIANEIFAANEVDGVKSGDKLIEKCEKLSKTRKLSKSQKSAKLRKKLLKSRNSPNFNAKNNRSSFLTPNTRMTFNHLWLIFTKAPIF